ncbi:unnamed protein product [Trichobilharzia szidati]|nr:unnamed protein product [Trichobilharzia szidati]
MCAVCLFLDCVVDRGVGCRHCCSCVQGQGFFHISSDYSFQIDAEVDALMTGALDQETEEIREFMDLVQSSFHCCGAKGPQDYAKKSIPPSCKGEGNVTYNEGCVVVFGSFLKRNLIIVACVAFGVCFFQLLSIIIACCLGQQIREYENV